ncbi:unnamed protein product, partial [Phaeothamnion confervicola]
PRSLLELTRQFDQEKIETLEGHVEKLRLDNEEMRAKLQKNETDTHELVAYFQREMSEKDAVSARLSEQLKEEQGLCRRDMTSHIQQLTHERDHAAAQAHETARALEKQWQGQLKAAQAEMAALEKYRDGRVAHEAEVATLRAALTAGALERSQAEATMERAFFAEKARAQREAEAREAELRGTALEEARRSLTGEARRLGDENNKLAGELRFHVAAAADLEADKKMLAVELTAVRREAELTKQRDEEQARRGFVRAKQMKALEQRVDSLQKALDDAVGAGRRGAETAAAAANRELQESRLEGRALKQLLALKNRELQHVRRLSQYILEQRSDVEAFFLEALEEVRQKVLEDRTTAHRKALAESQRRIRQAARDGGLVPNGALPLVQSAAAAAAGAGPASRLPTDPDARVHIRDLTWQDKERVLRLLFARINHVQGTIGPLPDHPLEQAFIGGRQKTFITEPHRITQS